VIEIHKGVRGPELKAQLLAGDEFAGLFQQHAQHSQRLALQPDPASLFVKFSRAEVDLEVSEAEPCANRTWRRHAILANWTKIRHLW
jgi:hypothetical protein